MNDESTLLTDLFRAYFDARKHKRNTKSQLTFEVNLEENLIELYNEIKNRTYRVGRSICFMTTIPVKREVFAAGFRDRVVHHLLFNYIAPLFERTFIADNYSCRKGRGTLYGINRCEHHIRSCSDNYQRYCYILKLDIEGYFMNIDRQILYDIIMATLHRFADRPVGNGKKWVQHLDYDLLEYLIREIVFNDPTDGCEMRGTKKDWEGLPRNKSLFYTGKGCGLPIGNLTSQLFSNVYLTELDNYVKRTLGEKHYGRYVDDFYIVNRDKDRLLLLIPIIHDFLEKELHLRLHPNKIYLQGVDKGVNFLGVTIKPYRRYLMNKTKKRINKRMYDIARHPEMDIDKVVSVVNSYFGYMKHLNCWRYKQKLIARNEGLLLRGRFKGEGQDRFVPWRFIGQTDKNP